MLLVWISKTVIKTGDTEQTKITDWERNGAANPTYKSIYVLRGESVSANLKKSPAVTSYCPKILGCSSETGALLTGKMTINVLTTLNI